MNSSTTSFHSQLTSTASAIPSPRHPIPALHPAFLESIREANEADARAGPITSAQRSAGSKLEYHRFTKLIAQLTFGLHLLHTRTAKSETAAVAILQTHIDSLDHFLSSTSSAVSLASDDISVRLENLSIPLSTPHSLAVFDQMLLSSRSFRREILSRNGNVEYVVRRTTKALDRAMSDVGVAEEAVRMCGEYMRGIREGWGSVRLERVYEAMTHNVKVWNSGCKALKAKGNRLRVELRQLAAVVLEIESRTGKASRLSVCANKELDGATGSTVKAGKAPIRAGGMVMGWKQTLVEKPLPQTPKMEARLESLGIRGEFLENDIGSDGGSDGEELRHRMSRRLDSDSQDGNITRRVSKRKSYPEVVKRSKSQKTVQRAGSMGKLLATKVRARCSSLKPPSRPVQLCNRDEERCFVTRRLDSQKDGEERKSMRKHAGSRASLDGRCVIM